MYKKFDELFIDETRYGTKIKTDQYLSEGKYPIVDQGQKKISGYTDIEDGIFKEVPAIIFGDHTRLIKYIDAPFFIGADGVKIIRSRLKEINYKYLYYALLNVSIPNTGYNRHFKWLKETKIYYPDSEKQKYIVEVLDKISLIIEKKNKQIEQWDFLLKSLFIEMFGDISDQENVEVSRICKLITDGTHQPPKFEESGIPFLFVSNIVTNNITYDTEKFISEETYKELIKRTPIEIGDLLLSTVGSYGHSAIVKFAKRFCFQRHIAYLKPKSEIVDSEYFRSAILSDNVQRQIHSCVRGIAQKTLNLSEIRKLCIPLPPMVQQQQFANIVRGIDKSKLAVKKSLEELEILKKSLMQKYFA